MRPVILPILLVVGACGGPGDPGATGSDAGTAHALTADAGTSRVLLWDQTCIARTATATGWHYAFAFSVNDYQAGAGTFTIEGDGVQSAQDRHDTSEQVQSVNFAFGPWPTAAGQQQTVRAEYDSPLELFAFSFVVRSDGRGTDDRSVMLPYHGNFDTCAP